MNPTFLRNSVCDETHTMNFQNAFSTSCIDKIIQHKNTHVARERINKHQEDGNDSKERLAKHAKFSAGNNAKAGTNRLGKDTLRR